MAEVEIYIGTFRKLEFNIGDDLSSHTIGFYIGRGHSIILTKTDTEGIDMTDAATGTLYIDITPEDTKTLGLGIFKTELRAEIDSKPEIWYQGEIQINNALYIPQ